MTKAVAVPYVIALILGIIVVAVIGYWFFVVAGGGGGQLSLTQCQARFIAFCTQYSAAGYQPSGQTFSDSACTSYISSDSLINGGGETACRAALHQTTCTPPAPDPGKLGCTSSQKVACVNGNWACQ